MRHTDMAPAIFTNSELETTISAYTTAAEGMGRQWSMFPDENGWTEDSPFDIDPFQEVVDLAIAAAQRHAKANRLFYNGEKLQDNVLDLMATAFRYGWDHQRRTLAKVDPKGEAEKSAVHAE